MSASPDGFGRGRRKPRSFERGSVSQVVAARGYELVSDSLMSASACFVAFWASVLEFAVGRSVWMALPRLIDLPPLPAGHADPLVGVCPVMSACMQAKLIPRFLLT